MNNIFLNGILDKDVYMAQLEVFIDPYKPHYVCKLKKTLYDLKQALKAWFDRFKTTTDSSLMYKWDNWHILLVLMYVDDIIITCSHPLSVFKIISNM